VPPLLFLQPPPPRSSHANQNVTVPHLRLR
jgi:hypothetical protein